MNARGATQAFFAAVMASVAVSGGALPAQTDTGPRAELEQVLAHHRLATSGPALVLRTCDLYADEFRRNDQPQLARIAVGFEALAALQLGQRERLERLCGQLSDADSSPDWLRRGTAANKSDSGATVPLPIGDGRDWIAAQITAAVGQLDAGAFESEFESEGVMLQSDGQPRFRPALTLRQADPVEVEYQFFDPAFFPASARRAAESLYETVENASSTDGRLVAVWCRLWLDGPQSAAAAAETLKSRDGSGALTADQKQELQCVMVAIADAAGQSDLVDRFLQSRLSQPPAAIWAQRGLTLIDERYESVLNILQRRCADLADGRHPFSRPVLGNVAGQTSGVLDQYWEVAFAHRQVAVARSGWFAGRSPPAAALEMRQLVAELISPTVLEPWRAMTLLRLALIFEAGLLTGDTESWQLMAGDSLRGEHPVLNPLVRLSRDHSGLMRTAGGDDPFSDLADESTEEVVALLWGDSDATLVRTPVADQATDNATAARLALTLVLAVVFLVLILGIRHLRRRIG